MSVAEGLDFILWHLWDCHSHYNMYPRRISTKLSDGRQFPVYSRDEALKHFSRSHYIDCRISAYPFNVIKHPPNFIFIDIDRNKFEYNKEFIEACNNSVKLINTLGGNPTIIWSGNGCHIYLPIECYNRCDDKNMEDSIAKRIELLELDTRKVFLKFCEQYLSNYMSDPQHNPSIHSCMLRVPNTINSKNNKKVTIYKQWDGVRPSICKFMWEFYRYLHNMEEPTYDNTEFKSDTTWISMVLQNSFSDNRKYLLWRVLCPYLINVKKMDRGSSFGILKNWLVKCNKINPVKFNINVEVRNKLKSVNGYFPLSLDKIKSNNFPLYKEIIHMMKLNEVKVN